MRTTCLVLVIVLVAVCQGCETKKQSSALDDDDLKLFQLQSNSLREPVVTTRTVEELERELNTLKKTVSELKKSLAQTDRDLAAAIEKDASRRLITLNSFLAAVDSTPELEPHCEVLVASLNGSTLHCDSIRTMSSRVASILAGHSGKLVLPELTEMSDESAEILKRHEGVIEIDNVGDISAVALKNLLLSNTLSIQGLRHLTPEAASLIVENWKDRPIHLDRMTDISLPTLAILVKRYGTLSLNGISRLTDEQAKLLEEGAGYLELNGLQELTLGQAECLGHYDGGLELDGLEQLADGIIQALARGRSAKWQNWDDFFLHSHGLTLNGLKDLEADDAKHAARCARHLELNGLTSLSTETAQSLALSFDDVVAELDRLQEVYMQELEKVYEPSDYIAHSLELNGITELPAEVAAAFSGRKIDLHFDGITELPAEVAAAFSGRANLHFGGISSLSYDAAKAVSSHEGKFDFPNLGPYGVGSDAYKLLSANRNCNAPKLNLPIRYDVPWDPPPSLVPDFRRGGL